jgi:membrane protein implicated in regulation of membrane protease activity
MWILNWLPDSLIHLAVFLAMFGGLALYVLGMFISFVPPALPYKEPIKFFAVVLMVVGVYGYGSYDNEMSWRSKEADLKHQVEVSEEKAKVATEALANEIARINQKIKDTQAKVKDAIKTHTNEMDATCKVPPVAITILNDAAVRSKK